MKLIRGVKNITQNNFGALTYGECFIYEDDVWIKQNHSAAVNLSDGAIYTMFTSSRIVKWLPEAEVITHEED